MPTPASSSRLLVGTQLDLPIHGLSHDGQGVGRIEQQVVFVPGALPGEQVRVRLVHRAKRHFVAELLSVLEPSPDRRRPPCILAERCGGCSIQHLAAPAQAHWKEDRVRQALARIGGLQADVRPILTDDHGGLSSSGAGFGYRNRATIPLERLADGRLRAGFYRTGSHRIVNMNHCPVLDPRLDALIQPLKDDLEASDWPVDANLSADGGLRHLALRIGHCSGECLITLISSHSDLPGIETMADSWMERFPQVVGVCLNLQPKATNTLMGPETEVIVGRDWISDSFSGLRYRIGADTFFQVHASQAERVVQLVLDAIPPSSAAAGRVIDAYCGVGTFSLPLAKAGHAVLGIEQQSRSIDQARRNALSNGLEERCRFVDGDVALLLQDSLQAAKALVLDPPRKGLDPEVVAIIEAAPPPTVIYISCDPSTLARDLAQLCREGGAYSLQRVQPVDFFPQTSHVEAVAVLQRNSMPVDQP